MNKQSAAAVLCLQLRTENRVQEGELQALLESCEQKTMEVEEMEHLVTSTLATTSQANTVIIFSTRSLGIPIRPFFQGLLLSFAEGHQGV